MLRIYVTTTLSALLLTLGLFNPAHAQACVFVPTADVTGYADLYNPGSGPSTVFAAGTAYPVLNRTSVQVELQFDDAFSAWVSLSTGQLRGNCDGVQNRVAIAGENVRLWQAPDVRWGSVVADVAENTLLQVISGPVEGRIRTDADINGNWYLVYDATQGVSGWVWEDRIAVWADSGGLWQRMTVE